MTRNWLGAIKNRKVRHSYRTYNPLKASAEPIILLVLFSWISQIFESKHKTQDKDSVNFEMKIKLKEKKRNI